MYLHHCTNLQRDKERLTLFVSFDFSPKGQKNCRKIANWTNLSLGGPLLSSHPVNVTVFLPSFKSYKPGWLKNNPSDTNSFFLNEKCICLWALCSSTNKHTYFHFIFPLPPFDFNFRKPFVTIKTNDNQTFDASVLQNGWFWCTF